MTKFRVCSDLHLEFDEDLSRDRYSTHDIVRCSYKYLPEVNNENDMYLIIAGDIHTKLLDVDYAEGLFGKRFKHIYIVMGNHSYYKTYISKTFKNSENVTVLENDVITTQEEIIIAGCTLWTDMNKQNPMDMLKARGAMADYRWIDTDATSGESISPEHTAQLSLESYKWLDSLPDIDIVITHHMPSYDCVHEKYRGAGNNFCFASEYDDLIYKLSPKYWIFGHSHECMDFQKGDTRMINNAYGYPFEITGYVDDLIIEI